MFKQYIDKYINVWLDSTFDIIFNHILTFTSLLAVLTFLGHYFFPHFIAQIDAANMAILTAMRKGI